MGGRAQCSAGLWFISTIVIVAFGSEALPKANGGAPEKSRCGSWGLGVALLVVAILVLGIRGHMFGGRG